MEKIFKLSERGIGRVESLVAVGFVALFVNLTDGFPGIRNIQGVSILPQPGRLFEVNYLPEVSMQPGDKYNTVTRMNYYFKTPGSVDK